MTGLTDPGLLLRRLRESRKVSLRQLERKGGPSRETVRLYESGESCPTESSTLQILAAMGVPASAVEAVEVIAAVRQCRGMPPTTTAGMSTEQRERLIEGMVGLLMERDPRRRTEVLELAARQDVMSVLARAIGG